MKKKLITQSDYGTKNQKKKNQKKNTHKEDTTPKMIRKTKVLSLPLPPPSFRGFALALRFSALFFCKTEKRGEGSWVRIT